MRILLSLLCFAPLLLQAQCPDADSVMRNRIQPLPITGIDPFPVPIPRDIWGISIGTWTVPYVVTVQVSPVNNDPKTGPKKWLKNGYCRVYYPNREDTLLQATGRYINGKKSGTWVWYDESGKATGTGKYVNGLKTGTWKEGATDRAYYKGVYMAGRREGEWLGLQKNDAGEWQVFQRTSYHLGRDHGKSIYYEEGIKISECNYTNGLLDGKCTNFHHGGKLSGISWYQKGKILSERNYSESGKITSSKFYTGNTRKEIVYTENGKTIEQYYGDKKHGWQYGYENGRLVYKENFYRGVQHGYSFRQSGEYKNIEWYKNGALNGLSTTYQLMEGKWVLTRRGAYKNGLPEGEQFDLLKDGTKQYVHYINNTRHGAEYTLSPQNDTLKSAFYVHGKLNGRKLEVQGISKTIEYYVNGVKTERRTYSNGELKDVQYWRNGLGYMRARTKELPGGRLLEEEHDAQGLLKSKKEFGPEGSGLFTLTTFFPSGKIKSFSDYQHNENKSVSYSLNEYGDTTMYMYTDRGQKGRSIETMRHYNMTYRFKSFFNEHQRNGQAQIYLVDSTRQQRETLLASGTMQAGMVLGKWIMYHSNGQLKYEGCMCGDSEDKNGIQYFYRKNLTAVDVLDRSLPCGDYRAYYPSGKLYQEKNENAFVQYYENGVVEIKGFYKGLYKRGEWTYYSTNGAL